MSLLKWLSNISPFRGLPVDDKGSSSSVTTQTGETVQLYYNNAGTLTADAGQAAGVVVIGRFNYNNIKNSLGDMEAKKGDTSLSFTCLAATSEVGMPVISPEFVESLDTASWSVRMAAIGSLLTTNGQYFVDYTHGVIYIKKATTASTMTSVSYKYNSAAGASGSGAAASQVQGTAAADAAAVGNPVQVGGVYVSADPTLTSGDVYPLKHDSKGNLNITSATLLAGENLTRNVQITSLSNASSRITTSTTTVCKSGAGSLVGLWVEVATTGIITIYDNTAASGTVLLTLPAALPVGEHVFPMACSLGVTVVTAAADRVAVSVQ